MNKLGYYLAPDLNTFWDWNESGEAVTWWNGCTLALYEELDLLIREMQPNGLPRFEELLLVLAATRRDWPEADGQASFFLGRVNALDPQGWKEFPIFQWLKPLCDRLNDVHKCARQAGHGAETSRALVKYIFADSGDAMEEDEAAQLCDRFTSGEVSLCARDRDRLPTDGKRNPPLALLQSVRNLVELLAEFDPATDVKRLLQTGLPTDVNPADVDDLPFTERLKRLLLDLDEEQGELRGLVRVARQLSAVINLPRRLSDPLDQPVGGYSDVSNRGNIDRLLVSELAQDADVLAVRVALNEALYLRRESPPEEPTNERHIFIDTGVRMWGVPRVYAYGVALAFAAENYTGRESFVYTHERDAMVPAEIDSREGLETLMTRLSPDPDPGVAVPAFFNGVGRIEGGADCVLVTTEKVWRDRRFRIAMGPRRPEEFFVALVDRDGWLQLLQVTGAGERELKRLRLDIDELLGDERRNGKAAKLIDADEALPQFLRMKEAPLRFGLQVSPERAHFHHEAGLLGHTADGLLFLWKRVDMGALMLTSRFPKGRPFWVEIDNNQREAVCLFDRDDRVLMFRVGLDTGQVSEVEIKVIHRPQFVHRIGEVLVFLSGRNVFAHRMFDGRCVGRTTLAAACKRISDHFVQIGDSWFAMRLGALATGKVAKGKSVPLNAENTELLHFEELPARDALYVWSNSHWPEPLVVRSRDGLSQVEPTGRVILRVDGQVLGVSTDKDRLFVTRGENEERLGTGYSFNVRDNAETNLYGQLSVFDLEPEAARLQSAIPQLRNKFTGVFLSAPSGLHLATRKQRLLSLGMEGARVKRIVWREDPLTQHMVEQGWTQPVDWHRRDEEGAELVTSAQFERCDYRFTGRFELSMCEFLDGSRIFLDRRGLLHLKSSDRRIPEVSIVLKEGEASGWCSNGDYFGSVYFIGKHKSRARDVYSHIERFVAHIIGHREQGMLETEERPSVTEEKT